MKKELVIGIFIILLCASFVSSEEFSLTDEFDFTYLGSEYGENKVGIEFAGKEFLIDTETDGVELALRDKKSDDLIILREGEKVLIDGVYTDGTYVSFNGNVSSLLGFQINVAAEDSDKDAIVEGEPFVDPVFGTFEIMFDGIGEDNEGIYGVFYLKSI